MGLERPEEFAHEFYRLIRSHLKANRIAPNRASLVLQYVFGGAFSTWNVIGITKEALEKFTEEKFATVPKGLHRAHLTKRRDTYLALLNEAHEKSLPELKEYVAKNEDCVICLSGENSKISDVAWYPVRRCDDLFASKFIGFEYRRNREDDFLRKLYDRKGNVQMHCIKCWRGETGNCAHYPSQLPSCQPIPSTL